MAKVDEQLELILRSAWAESTLRTRNSQWKKFIEFCVSNKLTAVPADSWTADRFLVNQAKTCAYSTCNNYLSAVITLHRFFGHDRPFREYFVINMVLKGLSRHLGKEVNQKIGLTPLQLCNIYDLLDLSDINVITKWASLMLSFRSLLRKSNIVQTVSGKMDMVIERSDVEFTSEGILLKVRKTKTIQRKEYVLQVPVHFTTNRKLCAASMLTTHLVWTEHIKEGPLFLVLKKGQWKPLLYGELLSFIKYCITLIGSSPSDAGLHSMRRSGAAYLHSIGVSLVDIISCVCLPNFPIWKKDNYWVQGISGFESKGLKIELCLCLIDVWYVVNLWPCCC